VKSFGSRPKSECLAPGSKSPVACRPSRVTRWGDRPACAYGLAFAGGCPSLREGRGMTWTVGDTGSRDASACVSSGSGVGAGNFSGKTGLIAVKWKSWGEVGIREKVCGTQEIGLGSRVRARHAWVCHARLGACACVGGCAWVWVGVGSAWRFGSALKTNRKGSSKLRRKRVRWIQRKGEKGGFLVLLGVWSGKVG
jgi:hypothetical protein